MKTILVVEDDTMNCELIKEYLTLSGFKIITANNGVQAIELACTARPNLIVMDMGLPVMDGWTASSRLKQSVRTRSIPIIALTAYVFAEDRKRAQAAGCDEFETKPINFASLRTKIHRLIAQSEAHAG